jgi:hypothetical protein
MKRRWFIGLVILCLVLFIAPLRPDLAHGAKKFVSIASGWVTGVYFPLAGAISRIVYEKVPELKVTVESSGASVANAKLIATGDADLAILQNDIAFYALKGVKPMFEKAVPNIRSTARFMPARTPKSGRSKI